jgi:hypothetical protein
MKFPISLLWRVVARAERGAEGAVGERSGALGALLAVEGGL